MIDRRREIGYPVQCGELLPATKEMYSIFPRGTNLEELFDIDDSLTAGSCSSVEFISPGGRVYSSDFVSHALDRRIFDKHLVSLAIERGARVEKGVSLTSIEDGVANTTIGEVRAKVIDHLSHMDLEIEDFRTAEPSLEDAFVKLIEKEEGE